MDLSRQDFRSPDPLDAKCDPWDQSNQRQAGLKEALETIARHSPEQLWDPPDQSNEKSKLKHLALKPPGLDVRRLRKRLRLPQRHFAWIFGFPVATLRHWERGNRQPTGTALVLLHVIHENPRVVRQAVMKARKRAPASLGTLEPPKSHRAPPGTAVYVDSRG